MPTAGSIMDRSASLLNDTAKTIFTYVAQLPYLNTAIDELQESLEQDNAEMSNKVTAPITVAVGTLTLNAAAIAVAAPDLVEIQQLLERTAGTQDDFVPMIQREFLPATQKITTALTYWTYQGQEIFFIGALTNREVKIQYVAARIANVTVDTDNITLNNCKSFLAFRTAGLCAEFIGENPERAAQLNAYAKLALDRVIGINAKGRQAIVTRRRPFMAAYKVRGWN